MHNHVLVILSLLSALGIIVLHFYSKRSFGCEAVGYFDIFMWLISFTMVGAGIYFGRQPEGGLTSQLCFVIGSLSSIFSFINIAQRTNLVTAVLSTVLIVGSSYSLYIVIMFFALHMILPIFLYFAIIRPIFSKKVKT